ncbi:MAG: RICIN domain-containing protein [Agriterribacter sp.]
MKIPALFFSLIASIASCTHHPTFDPAKNYQIIAKHSQKSLTLSYNRPLQTVNDTEEAAYRWAIKYYPDSTAQIISLPSGEAMEVAEIKDQVLPYVTNADSSNIRQRFRITHNNDGTTYLVSAYSNYCVDVSESDTSAYAVITTWPVESNPNQKWKVLRSPDTSVVFASLLSGKYLAVTPGTKAAGANIGQWPFADREEQTWTLQQQDNGAYTIRNRYSGMYLQESDGTLSLQYNVQQSPDPSVTHSHWYFDDAKDGYVKFRNAASGYCMDVRDGVPYDGANIMTYDCNDNGDNQHWKIVEVSNIK